MPVFREQLSISRKVETKSISTRICVTHVKSTVGDQDAAKIILHR